MREGNFSDLVTGVGFIGIIAIIGIALMFFGILGLILIPVMLMLLPIILLGAIGLVIVMAMFVIGKVLNQSKIIKHKRD